MAARDWERLGPEERAALTAARRRTHGSARGELRHAVEDARTALLDGIIAWLRERGHGAAANDLDDAWWER